METIETKPTSESALWIVFKSLNPRNNDTDSYILQVMNDERPRDSSRIALHPMMDGKLKTQIPCALQKNEITKFSLHVIKNSSLNTSSTTLLIQEQTKTSKFEIDTTNLIVEEEQQQEQEYTVETEDNKYKLVYTICKDEPTEPKDGLILSLDEDIIDIIQEDSLSVSPTPINDINTVITSVDSPSNSNGSLPNPTTMNMNQHILPDLSFSTVSEDDDDYLFHHVDSNDCIDMLHHSILKSSTCPSSLASSPLLPKKRVSFNSKVKRIPTTEILQKQLQIANNDRANLWNSITDLTLQLNKLKTQLKYTTLTNNNNSNYQNCSFSTISSMSTISIPDDISNINTPTLLSPVKTNPTKTKRHTTNIILDGDMIGTYADENTFDINLCIEALKYFKRKGSYHKIIIMISKYHVDNIKHQQQNMYLQYLRNENSICIYPFDNNNNNEERMNFLLSYALDYNADIISNAWISLQSDSPPTSPSASFNLNDSIIIPFMFIDNEFVPDRTKLSISLDDDEEILKNNYYENDSIQANKLLKRCGTL